MRDTIASGIGSLPAVIASHSGRCITSRADALRLVRHPRSERFSYRFWRRAENPFREFRFKAPLTVRGGISLCGPIGGPQELTLDSLEREGEMATVVTGVVDAPTEPAAIAFIEEIVEAILGLALALDMCMILAP